MADMSFFPSGGGSSGGGGTGVTDYNQLSNRPVINLTGDNVVISQLTTGVYNIKGTWKITEDDVVRGSENDDLFYVLNDGEICKLTWLCAGQIKQVTAPIGGKAEDITIDDVATTGDITGQLVGDF